jgi:hypothetical protein
VCAIEGAGETANLSTASDICTMVADVVFEEVLAACAAGAAYAWYR